MNYIPERRRHRGHRPGRVDGRSLLLRRAKGKRYALPPHADHDRRRTGGIGGSASNVEVHASSSCTAGEVPLASIAARRSMLEQIEADADRDRWLAAGQRSEYGLVDQVITSAARGRRRRAPAAKG